MNKIQLTIKKGQYDIDTHLFEFYNYHEIFFKKRNVNSKEDLVCILKWSLLKNLTSNIKIIFSLGFYVDYINKQLTGYVYQTDNSDDENFTNNYNSAQEGAAIMYALNIDSREYSDSIIFRKFSELQKFLAQNGAWPESESDLVSDSEFEKEPNGNIFVSSKDRYMALFKSTSIQTIHYLFIKTSLFNNNSSSSPPSLFALSNSNKAQNLLTKIRNYAPTFFSNIHKNEANVDVTEIWSTTFNDCVSIENDFAYYCNCYRTDSQNQCVLPVVDVENRSLFLLSDSNNFWSISDIANASKPSTPYHQQKKLLDSLLSNSKTTNVSESFNQIGIFELPKRGISSDFKELNAKEDTYDNNTNYYHHQNNNNTKILIDVHDGNDDDDKKEGEGEGEEDEIVEGYENIVVNDGGTFRDVHISPTIREIINYEKSMETLSLQDEILNEFTNTKCHVQTAFLIKCLFNSPSYVFDVTPEELLQIHLLFNSQQLALRHDNKDLFLLCVNKLFNLNHSLSAMHQFDNQKYISFNINNLRSFH